MEPLHPETLYPDQLHPEQFNPHPIVDMDQAEEEIPAPPFEVPLAPVIKVRRSARAP